MPSLPVPAEQLQQAVAAFIVSARAKFAGGLTVAEFGSLVVELLRRCVVSLESLPVEGAAKKAWAIEAVAVLFDSVADLCVPTLLKPAWWLIRPAVRSLVLSAAGGALEQVLSLVREVSSDVPAKGGKR